MRTVKTTPIREIIPMMQKKMQLRARQTLPGFWTWRPLISRAENPTIIMPITRHTPNIGHAISMY